MAGYFKAVNVNGASYSVAILEREREKDPFKTAKVEDAIENCIAFGTPAQLFKTMELLLEQCPDWVRKAE